MAVSYVTRRSLGRNGDLPDFRGLDRVLDQALSGWLGQGGNGTVTSAWSPACDVFETAGSVKIVLEVPGVRPEDVKISLEEGMLRVLGEKKQVAEEQAERIHRYERTYGTFERRFNLPGTIDTDHIEANYEHGLLTIVLPKVERARPRQIPVRVG